MTVEEGENTDLPTALANIVAGASRVEAAAKSTNETPENVSLDAIVQFAKGAANATESSRDELRDNLTVVYGLAVRPTLGHDQPSYSLLLLDRAINDLRDSIIAAERIAKSLGFPSQDESPTPEQFMVNQSLVQTEIKELSNKIASIEGDIASIKIMNNQVGLVNINVEQLTIKIGISKALLAAKKLFDYLAAVRLFKGIKRSISEIWNNIALAADAASKAATALIERALSVAEAAVQIVISIGKKVGAPDLNTRIWTESEIHDLLNDGGYAPQEARHFVKNLSLHGSYIDLRNIEQLTELKSLNVTIFEESNIDILGTLINLEDLVVQIRAAKGVDLSALGKLVKLKSLTVRGLVWRMNGIVTPDLRNCGSLRELELDRINLDRFPRLPENGSLESLSLTGTTFPINSVAETLPTLRKVELRDTPVEAISFLEKFPNVEEIDLRSNVRTGFEVTQTLRSLKRMSIRRSQASWYNLRMIPRRVEVRGDQGGLIRKSSY